MRTVEGVLPHRKVEALFLRFGETALIFRVRWWLESYYDTRRMFDKVNSAIYAALNEKEITIAPPSQVDTFHHLPEKTMNEISTLTTRLD